MAYNSDEIAAFFEEETDYEKGQTKVSKASHLDDDLDDIDSEYYEHLTGEIQDINDPEINGYFDALSEEEFESFVEADNIDSVIPKELLNHASTIKSIHKDLSNAKRERLQGNISSCISICKDILSVTKSLCIQKYAKNLMIAAYGDAESHIAFELAVKEMYSGNQDSDFKNTLLGLLSKNIDLFSKEFLVAMHKTQKDVLIKYYDSLGDMNPKKHVIWEAIHLNQ